MIICFAVLASCQSTKNFDLNEKMDGLMASKVADEEKRSSFNEDEVLTIQRTELDNGLQIWQSHIESSFGEESYTYYSNGSTGDIHLIDKAILKRLCDEEKNNCLERERIYFENKKLSYTDKGSVKLSEMPSEDDWNNLLLTPNTVSYPYETARKELEGIKTSFGQMSENVLMEGMYLYYADAARFTLCGSDESIAVAFDEDHINLERAYLKMDLAEMQEVYVRVLGRIEERPAMEGDQMIPQLIVSKAISAYVNQSCK